MTRLDAIKLTVLTVLTSDDADSKGIRYMVVAALLTLGDGWWNGFAALFAVAALLYFTAAVVASEVARKLESGSIRIKTITIEKTTQPEEG